jgi:hypothetical protein
MNKLNSKNSVFRDMMTPRGSVRTDVSEEHMATSVHKFNSLSDKLLKGLVSRGVNFCLYACGIEDHIVLSALGGVQRLVKTGLTDWLAAKTVLAFRYHTDSWFRVHGTHSHLDSLEALGSYIQSL